MRGRYGSAAISMERLHAGGIGGIGGGGGTHLPCLR